MTTEKERRAAVKHAQAALRAQLNAEQIADYYNKAASKESSFRAA